MIFSLKFETLQDWIWHVEIYLRDPSLNQSKSLKTRFGQFHEHNFSKLDTPSSAFLTIPRYLSTAYVRNQIDNGDGGASSSPSWLISK